MHEPGETELVVLETARSPFEAQVIAAVLRAAEIPAFVAGSLLADEFAASQRLMNLGGVRVQVPANRLTEAREALAEAREAGQVMSAAVAAQEDALVEQEPPPRAAPEPRSPLRVLIWPLVALIVVWLLVNQPGDEVPGPYDVERTSDGFRYRWRDSGAIAFEQVDRDRDGLDEVVHFHNRQGVRVATSYDHDGNGVVERAECYASDGSVATVSLDADGDGRFERWQEFHPGGTRTWIDTDGDARYDRVEERDAKDGLVRAWRIDAAAGFVLER